MGWMPAPIDVSVFHSLWVEEQTEKSTNFNTKEALFDFNIGYVGTLFLGVCFVILGALVMFGSGRRALTARTPAFGRRRGRLASTTASSWSTSSCCAAARA